MILDVDNTRLDTNQMMGIMSCKKGGITKIEAGAGAGKSFFLKALAMNFQENEKLNIFGISELFYLT